MASSQVHKLILHVLLCFCLFKGYCAEETTVYVSVRVGEEATLQCSPKNVPQDGVYVQKLLQQNQKILYFFHDGSFTTENPRMYSNEDLSNFIFYIRNVTVGDSGLYWCEFNKEDKHTVSMERSLLFVSGNKTQCPGEQGSSFETLIIVCMVTAFSMVLLIFTIILLWGIPKVKGCCEHGNYTSTQEPSDSRSTHSQQPLNSEYEVMHRPFASHTLVNPAYESTCGQSIRKPVMR